MRKAFSLLCLIVVVLASIFVQLFVGSHGATPKHTSHGIGVVGAVCSSDSCGAIDPVNEPDYNVREVIKNTLLIEQHLADDRKYCRQCLVKHFLLSIGLLEEAVWMAGSKCDTFPMLAESVGFYNSVFDDWYAAMDDKEARLQQLDRLREWRRQMVEGYYFAKKSDVDKSI